MSRLAVVNLWERKVFVSQCSYGTHIGALIPSTCHLLYNGDLVKLFRKERRLTHE